MSYVGEPGGRVLIWCPEAVARFERGMNVRSHLDCIPCLLRQALQAVRYAGADEPVQETVTRRALALLREADYSLSPPALARQLHRLVREVTSADDPYAAIKEEYNAFALSLLPELEARIEASEDPLEAAVRVAIAGNAIDFGANSSVTHAYVRETIDRILAAELDPGPMMALREAVERAERIAYFGDNAGEIVFDRVLIEHLPEGRVTYVVRGFPVINDATVADAEAVGIDRVARVIDSGSDAPGTPPEDCRSEVRELLETADVVVAKGQGNYETLCDVERDIFFLLQVKCPVLARRVGCAVGSAVLSLGACLD